MTDITTSRNISTIVPVSHFGGITPLCVPMTPDSSFSEEVSERFSKRVSSLWERLGLVFFTEEQQPPAANDGQLVVNNFSSQIIFQLFGNKNTRRLVVKDQPGFVYLDNICKQHESRQKLISERISREMTERISSTDRLAQQVKSLYNALGDEKAECSSQLLVITLERLLKESAEHKSVTETEVVLLKRLQRTLRSSESVYETKLLERLSKVKDGQDITVDSRAEILSAISDYSADIRDSGLQRRAAELVMSAASESGSVEDVRKKLTQTIDRLHKVVYDESGIAGNGRMALLSYGPEEAATQNADRKPGVATVSPAVQQYDITRSVTELLQSAADEASTDKTLTAEQRIVSSYSGKSVEEIDKRIRRVYESIAAKDRSHSGQVISAANNVILSLISRRSAPVSVQHRAEGIVTQELITPVSQITTNEHGSNMGVLPTLTEPAAAPSAYFADLSSGVEQVYAVTDDVQSVSYRDIKKAVSQLMSSRTARNSVSAPLNRVLHNTNVTVNDIAINNENNHSDTAYNAYSGNIYRSQSTKLSEGQDIHHEHKFIDGTEMILNVQQGNVSNVNNVTTSGTVLPAEQNNYTLNRSGDVYFAENRQEAEKSGAQAAAAGSYRSRLDSKTLAALDEMIQSAGIRTNVRNTADEITDRYTVKEKPSDTVYEYVTTESQAADSVQTSSGRTRRRSVGGQQPDRMQINQLRTAAIMRRGVGITPANGSTLISSLVERASRDAELTHKGGAVNSSFSYRTIDSGENMVMLIPPTEMDRYQAESGYAKQMPPIDLKQKPEPEQQSQLQKKKKTAINVKEEPVTVKTIGSIEGMSREEISKLVDKVYEQLEVKLLRERRRRGL